MDRRFIFNLIDRIGIGMRSYTEGDVTNLENPRKLGERTILNRLYQGLGTISPGRRRTSLRLGIGDKSQR